MRVFVEQRTLRFRTPIATSYGPPLAVRLVRTVRRHADGPTLNEALAQTGMLQLAFCLLLSAGILAS